MKLDEQQFIACRLECSTDKGGGAARVVVGRRGERADGLGANIAVEPALVPSMSRDRRVVL